MSGKKCFIIMPITTPPESVSFYNNDNEHFVHVMKCLFIPAIEEAGFEPILPLTKGSDNIQGHIISNLESADLVFCDMSTQNPNVFFELGIRTALNKPICLVKDSLIEKVPLDTSLINHHRYSHDLTSWIVKQEIKKLVHHIEDSFRKSENTNSIWKYLGFKTTATPPENISGESGKIEYLTMQIDSIIKKLNEHSQETFFNKYKEKSIEYDQNEYTNRKMDRVVGLIQNICRTNVDNPNLITAVYNYATPDRIFIVHGGQLDGEIPLEISRIFSHVELKYGIKIELLD